MSKKKSTNQKIQDYLTEENQTDLIDLLKSLPKEDSIKACGDVTPTLLHKVTSKGYIDVIKCLVEDVGIGVDLKQAEGNVKSGQVPLHEACLYDHFDILKYLVSRGSDVNIKDHDGMLPIHYACQIGNGEMVEFLLKSGSLIDEKDNRGLTPLQHSIIRAKIPVTKCLLAKNADVHVVDFDGQTTLHYATEWGNKELVEILLNKGVDINKQDNTGQTALHLSIEYPDITQLLLDNGADESLRNNSGKAAIEKKLDMNREEYKAINSALSQHLKKDDTIRSQNLEAAARVQEKMRAVAIAGDADIKSAKSNVMAELLAKKEKQSN